jgi:glycosyltransferase involved in cell wall biosynthesis
VRIYWYWPFAKAEDLSVPNAVPQPGDELVLHTIPGRIPDPSVAPNLEVRSTLAGVGDERERSLRWAWARSRSYLARSRERYRTVRDGDFDVCHVMFLNYFTDWYDLSRLARHAALVFEVHDITPHHARLPRALERALLARQYRSPGRLVVRHTYLRDRLVDEFGVDPEQVDVVELYVVDVDAPARTEPGTPRRVLFFGTLRRNKGVDVWLEAIDLLRDEPDIEFVFAGRGAPEVEQLVADAAASNSRVTFEHGYAEPARKDHWYRSSDLVVLPYTEFSSMSAVLCDAYAYRVPVVASDVGALGAAVRADGTGRLVPPGDAAALAAAVRGLLTEREEWRAASLRTSVVSAQRSPLRTAERLRNVYARAIDAAR